jgi:KUP system potassium uptake protein
VKIAQGGWFPLLVAAAVFTVMATWKSGRRQLGVRLQAGTVPLDALMATLNRGDVMRVPGTAVYMAGNPQGTPVALIHNLKHNRVVHEHVVLLTFVATDDPHVPPEKRLEVESLPGGFTRLVARFGFMETPHLDEVLRACEGAGCASLLSGATFFLSRETVIATGTTRLRRWRARLFALLSRNAQSATAFFGLPVDRVVELGLQVEI